MKGIFEHVAEILIEALPAIFFITVLLYMMESGMIGGWIGKIAMWMFGA